MVSELIQQEAYDSKFNVCLLEIAIYRSFISASPIRQPEDAI